MSAGTNLGSRITDTLYGDFSENLTGAAAGSQPLMFAHCIGTPPTTAGLFAHGCIINQLDTTIGSPALFQNTGSLASPVWAPIATSGSALNFVATETGANNAIAGSTLNPVTLQTGLEVTVDLAHTLQAGANTFALNGGSAIAIKSHFNSANNIATAYAATGVITLLYDGTQWLDMSQ